jgi:hypothetical protein
VTWTRLLVDVGLAGFGALVADADAQEFIVATSPLL